jgi:transposase
LKQDPNELSGILSPEHATVTSRYGAFLERADYYLRELEQQKHLTKKLLWEEEYSTGRTGYRYSQFCYYLQRYAKSRSSSMVMVHEPGDKVLVDFAGDRLYLTDAVSGNLTPCEVLVMTLAYSHKTIAIALPSQRTEDLLWGLGRGLSSLGILPRVIFTFYSSHLRG